jgi:hypothetical protein
MVRVAVIVGEKVLVEVPVWVIVKVRVKVGGLV